MRKMAVQTLLLCVVVLLVGCTADSTVTATMPDDDTQPVAINFSTYIGKDPTAQDVTRDTYPTGSTGQMTLDKLKQTGFAVFATLYPYYIDDSHKNNRTSYELDKSAFVPNFMYNQKVTWSTDHWTYSPVKYWPNDYSAGDVGGGATGSGNNGRLAFFAYAPYSDKPSGKDNDDNNGIVNISSNTTGINHLTVTYRVPSIQFTPGGGNDNYREITPVTNSSDDMVDLLWAVPHFNQTKQSVNNNVHLLFKHALTKLNVKVQGVFDEVSTNNNNIDNTETKILIESIKISDVVIPRKAYMILEPLTPNATTPNWVFNKKNSSKEGCFINSPTEYYDVDDLTRSLLINGSTISSGLTSANIPLDTDTEYTTATASAKFTSLPAGVNNTQQNLLNEGYFYLFPSNANYKYSLDNSQYKVDISTTPITVNIKYYVITYDKNLTLNNPKYFSIIKNDITKTLDAPFTFNAGKEYTLLLKLGMTSTKFSAEVTSTEWSDGGSTIVPLPTEAAP